ncbi:MAG: WecB/TagA/CpsF family glycosyltransferase [Hyphomicrobiales bacterium]|nr:WecB/TagA/CpsF family glycosyltransferase [Hyphomicrobiales bacterium]
MSMIELDPVSTPTVAPQLRVNLVDMRAALDVVLARARARKGFTLFTVNLDHVVKLNRSRPFRDAYARADFITADGWPIVWLARGADRRKTPRDGSKDRRRPAALQRTTGADLLEPMCREAAKHGLPLYFVGPGEVSQAAGLEILVGKYAGLRIVGAETPLLSSRIDEGVIDAMAARIGAVGARVCIVSLGAPKQEVLADALRKRCPDVGFLCVGAALDFISGHAQRAPDWAQRVGMEWFWRMAGDPRRLVGRYAGCAIALIKLSLPSIFRRSPRLQVVDGE